MSGGDLVEIYYVIENSSDSKTDNVNSAPPIISNNSIISSERGRQIEKIMIRETHRLKNQINCYSKDIIIRCLMIINYNNQRLKNHIYDRIFGIL